MYREIGGYQIQIAPLNKKVVKIGHGMVWMERPGVFVAKGWLAPLSSVSPGMKHYTLSDAVRYAKYV